MPAASLPKGIQKTRGPIVSPDASAGLGGSALVAQPRFMHDAAIRASHDACAGTQHLPYIHERSEITPETMAASKISAYLPRVYFIESCVRPLQVDFFLGQGSKCRWLAGGYGHVTGLTFRKVRLPGLLVHTKAWDAAQGSVGFARLRTNQTQSVI